jgi:hypothetical protein
MAAPITNEPYSEQVSRAFDALKFATPQQLAMTAQAIQGNPQSPEALALVSANNFQQQQRSAAAQAPQQTVYQQQIGQLLASMQPPPQPAPMQGGIAGVGANQFAMQNAAAQDPMRNAGIGAAPENMPMQQAAAGGLIALAQGGEARGFSGLDGSYAVPELGTAEYPEEEEEEDSPIVLARQEAEDQYDLDTGEPTNPYVQYKDAPKTKTPPKNDTIVHTPAPGSSAARNNAAASALKRSVEEMMEVQGPSYELSEGLANEFRGEIKEANRDKWIGALTSGIGQLLSAQTPHLSQAVGQGLIGGFAGYQQGSKEEADLRKQLLGIQMGTEKERHADRRAATKSVLDISAATTKAQRARELEMDKLREKRVTEYGVADRLSGRAGAGNIVDPNERSKLIERYADQISKSAVALQHGWDMTRCRAEAERQIDAEMARAPAALKSVNPAPYNPLQAYGFIGGPLGGR